MRQIAPLTCCLRLHGFIPVAVLACMPLTALASEPMPRMPLEKEPAAWQRAGLEAALADPDFAVQYHALDCCLRKKWVAQLHFSTGQWLQWLARPKDGMQELAASAAVQPGVQTPPEVQREVLRLLKDEGVDIQAKGMLMKSLWKPGAGMSPEAQMEMARLIQKPPPGFFMLLMEADETLAGLGAGMTAATQEALLSFIQNPQVYDVAKDFAANALAHVGAGMLPQVRKAMLGLLLDEDAPPSLRSHAAEALGRLGPQMPPQALEFLLSVLRDAGVGETLRSVAASALALLGPHMPPEVQQALLAAYDEPPPANADEVTNKYHILFHVNMTKALELAGPEMPAAFQQRLADGFLKGAHAARKARLPVDGPALRALSGVRPQPDAAVVHALLAEFQDREASKDTLSVLANLFFQPLAARGALPPEVRQALLTCLQDEQAGMRVRSMAALALGSLGADATPAAKQALLVLLQNRNLPRSLHFHLVLGMENLGAHMPPEAGPVLAGIVQRYTALETAPGAQPPPAAPVPEAFDPFKQSLPVQDMPAPAPGTEPFTPSVPSPAGPAAPVPGAAPAADLETSPMELREESPFEAAVRTLGNLGEKMPPEAQAALIGVIEHQPGNRQTHWEAAHALAQMGDKLPPQTQQRLLGLLFTPGVPMEYELRLAAYQTLAVSGIHPVADAQVADLLARTYWGEPDAELRFYLYLWLGRSPAHLQAVRWLGHVAEDAPLGGTPPPEVLGLVSRFWPHSTGADAGHAALRLAMARRSSQVLTTHLKTRPLDEATQKVLRTLATQLAEDPAAECATALGQVQAALAAEEKAR